MKLSEHKDLKDAITALPDKEKDKLLVRLVAKDKVLTEHLHFKLLENETDLDIRKSAIKAEIDKTVFHLRNADYRDGLYYLRQLNSHINHFFKITKDYFGEAALKVYLMNSFKITYHSPSYRGKDVGYQFAVYYVKAADSLVKKVQKLHEDLQFDLSVEVNELLKKIYNSNLAQGAEYLKLPKEFGY